MTSPGSIIAPQPGWWVRTDQIGTNTGSGFGWAADAAGATTYRGTGSGTYGWATADAVGHALITYDATGAGAIAASSSAISWSHTAAVGGAVLAAVSSDQTPTATATYNGTAMTLLSTVSTGSLGRLFVFGKAGAGTGSAATVSVSLSGGSSNLCGNSTSYNNVSGFGTPVNNNGTGTSMSLGPVTPSAGQMTFQAFGAGGFAVNETIGSYNHTSRYNAGNSNTVTMLIGDAAGSSSISFTATGTDGAAFWCACAIPLIL